MVFFSCCCYEDKISSREDDVELLMCADANDIIRCLLSSSSIHQSLRDTQQWNREMEKLQEIQEAPENGSKTNNPMTISLYLIHWNFEFNRRTEFRCFIFNQQLTAISQYWMKEHFKYLFISCTKTRDMTFLTPLLLFLFFTRNFCS